MADYVTPEQAYRNRKCGPPNNPKRRFDSKKQAKRVISSIRRGGDGARYDVYLCPVCNWLHIGHHNMIY